MKNGRSRSYGHRFPPKIVSYAVWVYHRFCLSSRDVENLLAQRGIIVSHETVRIWCQKFGPGYRKLNRRRGRLGDIWHLDEVFIRINGQQQYLWRVVDQDGDVIDIRFSRAVISAPQNDSFEGCCAAREKNHFVLLPTN
jgi:putative transposase